MASAHFPSLVDAEVIEIEFLDHQGAVRPLRLLVDCGFTGPSHLILSKEDGDLVRSKHTGSHAVGALQGRQDRAWVSCRIPALRFRRTLLAVFADLSSLSLPQGVAGMVGLTFLRLFARWGAERTESGWRFLLSD